MPYGNSTYNKAYQNAITCLYNGYSFYEWDSCGLDEYTANEVWDKALTDTENLFNAYSVRIESCMGYI